jgi:hypothetical protein
MHVLHQLVVGASRRDAAGCPKPISTSERPTLSCEPNPGRRLRLGRGELQHARLALDHANASKIFYAIKLEGPHAPTKARVELAAKCLQRLHPILRCTLVRSSAGELLFEERAELRIPVLERFGTTARQVYASEAELRPCRLGESQHAIWLIHNSGTESEVVLDLQHLSVDGSSLVWLMHHLLDFALREPAPELSEVPFGQWPRAQCASLDATVARNFSLPDRARAAFTSLAKLVVPLVSSYPQVPRATAAGLDSHLTSGNRSACLLRVLSEADTARFVQRCKEERVTVTTGATAAFAGALGALLSGSGDAATPPLHIVCVCDTRTLCEPAVDSRDMSAHVTALPSFISSRGTHMWDFAREFKAHVAEHWGHMLQYAALWSDVLLALQPSRFRSPSLVVSSWSGKSPVGPRYSTFHVLGGELLQNTAHCDWISLSLYTISTKWGNRLHLSVLAPAPRFAPELLQRVADGGVGRIRDSLA